MSSDGALEIWALFSSAFISSTIAPGGSEGVLAWLVMTSSVSTGTLVAAATVGNTLGALTTLALGVIAEKGLARGIVPNSRNLGAVERIGRWGIPALFFSWLPIVGDALCFAAGWLGLPILRSALVILLGKLFRYSALAYFIG